MKWRPRKVISMITVVALILLLESCVIPQPSKLPVNTPQEITLRIEGVDAVKVEADDSKITKSMTIPNEELTLSGYCRIHEDTAYMQVTSVSSYTTDSIWNDLKILSLRNIKKLIVYMNNTGGSSFDGAGIYDQLRLMKQSGIHITTEGYGIIASAAVPIFLVGDVRIASENITFLIHPGALFKWGMFTETLKDLKSQTRMMEMARQRYAAVVADHSNLSADEVLKLMEEDTWFDAQQAKKWGMVDEIQ